MHIWSLEQCDFGKRSNTVQEQVQFSLLTKLKTCKSSCCALRGPKMYLMHLLCLWGYQQRSAPILKTGPVQKPQCFLRYTWTKGWLEGGPSLVASSWPPCPWPTLCGLASVRSYNKMAQLVEPTPKTNWTHLNVLLLGSDKCWSSELGPAVFRKTDFFTPSRKAAVRGHGYSCTSPSPSPMGPLREPCQRVDPSYK